MSRMTMMRIRRVRKRRPHQEFFRDLSLMPDIKASPARDCYPKIGTSAWIYHVGPQRLVIAKQRRLAVQAVPGRQGGKKRGKTSVSP